MRFACSACLAAALAVSTLPAAALEKPAPQTFGQQTTRLLQRVAAQYLLLFARTMVDLTYESLTIDGRTNDTVINGLVLRPRLPWDPDGACRIAVDRVAIADDSSLDRLSSLLEVSAITVPGVCLAPPQAMMLESFGYTDITLSGASIELAYDLPSSGADVVINAAIADAGEINAALLFDYVWISGFDPDRGPADMEPVAILSSAEISFENHGVWERVEPAIAAQFGGDLGAVPQMLTGMMSEMLAPPNQPLGEAEKAFVGNVAGEVDRFLKQKDRIVLSAAPEGGVRLSEDLFESPQEMIAALKPRLSSAPLASDAMIAPDALAAGLAGGEALDDANRLRIGEALITGLGAPQAVAEGVALLVPLAEAWHPRAALLTGEAMAARGDTAEAYAMALRAMAGGAAGAIALADGLEVRLDFATVLDVQDKAALAWPGREDWKAAVDAARQEGDISALRKAAFDAAVGRDMPRIYASAYHNAALAAAAGDRGAATLRRRLDARFTGPDGALDPAWRTVRDEAAQAALTAWTEGGMAERVAEKYGTAE